MAHNTAPAHSVSDTKRSAVSDTKRRAPLAIGLVVLASLTIWQVAEAVVSKLYSQNLLANSAVTGPSGVLANTLTHVVLDHAGLVNAGKSRADGQDLRISFSTTPLAMEVGAPAGMIGYHGLDAPTLLASPIPQCPDGLGLAAAYPFDGTLNTTSSFTLCNSGTAVTPSATPTVSAGATQVPGVFLQTPGGTTLGKAVSLDGNAGTQVAYPVTSASGFTQPENAQTLEFWVYLTDPIALNEKRAVLHQDDDDPNNAATQRLQVTIEADSTTTPERNKLVFHTDAREPVPSQYHCVENGGTYPNNKVPTPSPDCNGESFDISPSTWAANGNSCGTCTKLNTTTPDTKTGIDSCSGSTTSGTNSCPYMASTTSKSNTCTSGNWQCGGASTTFCTWSCPTGTQETVSTGGKCTLTTCNNSNNKSRCWTPNSCACTDPADGCPITSCSTTGAATPSVCHEKVYTPTTTCSVTQSNQSCTNCSVTCPGGVVTPSTVCSVTTFTFSSTCAGQPNCTNCSGTCSSSGVSSVGTSCSYYTQNICTEYSTTGAVVSPNSSTTQTAPLTPGSNPQLCDSESWKIPYTGSCGSCRLPNSQGAPPDMQVNASSPAKALTIDTGGLKGIPVRQWTHVAVAVNPTANSVTLYINGQSIKQATNVVTDTATGNPLPGWQILKSLNNNPFAIGADAAMNTTSSIKPIKGYVDAVAYYSRALSTPEIVAHAQAAMSVDGMKGTDTVALQTVTPITGFSGRAMSFDPANASYAMAPTSLLSGKTQWTVEFWVNPTIAGGTLVSSLPSFRVDLDATAKPKLSIGAASATATGAMSLATWHYVALTVNGSASKVYVDGQLVITAATAAAPTAPLLFSGAQDQTVTLAGGSTQSVGTASNASFFKGSIDEVAIHDHALTATEVAARSAMSGAGWNAGMGLSVSPLFFTTTATALATTTNSYHLDYSPTPNWAIAPIAFCGAPVYAPCNASNHNPSGTANVPIYKANVLNSKGVVRFDGAVDSLSTSIPVAVFGVNPTLSAFAVTKHAATTGTQVMFQAGGDPTGTTNGYQLAMLSGSSTAFKSYAGATTNSASGSAVDTNATIWDALKNVNSHTLYKNGTSFGTLASGTVLNMTDPMWVIGAQQNASNYFNGDLAELVVYNTALSTADQQKLEGYLAGKWGLTASLPAGHPYKTTPPVGDPSSFGINGLRFWLDATMLGLSDGDPVMVWYDSASYNRTGLTVATAPVTLQAPTETPLVTMTVTCNASYCDGSGNPTYTTSDLSTDSFTAPTIVITDTQGGTIKTTGTTKGARLIIPSGSPSSLQWNLTGATFTVSPPGAATVTPSLLSGNKILQLDLNNALPTNGSITIANAKFTNLTQAGNGQLWLDVSDLAANDTDGNMLANAEVADTHSTYAIERFIIGTPTTPGPQVTNAFKTPPFTGLNLLRFDATAKGGGVSVGKIVVDYTANSVVADADITNVTLQPLGWVEQTPRTAGSFTFVPPSGKTLAQDTTEEYTVQADVARIGDLTQGASGDQLIVTATADATHLIGTGAKSTKAAVVPSAAPLSVTHLFSGYSVTLTPSAGPYVVNVPITVNWSAVGSPGSSVDVYYLDTTANTSARVCAGVTTGSCSFTPTTATAANKAQFRVQDAANATSQGLSSAFTVIGTLALGDHSTGQAANAFVPFTGASMSVTNDLFHFKLTAAGETVSLTSLTFTWSSTGGGVVQGDITGLQLWQAGTQVPGTFTVGAGTIIFTGTGLINVAIGPQDFVLKGTANSLNLNDQMSISLTLANLANPKGVTSAVTLTPSGSMSSAASHIVAGYTVTPSAAPYPVGTPITVTWAAVGGAGTSVYVDYLVNGVKAGACAGTQPYTAPTVTCTFTPTVATGANQAQFLVHDAPTTVKYQGFSTPFTVGGALTIGPYSQGQATNAFSSLSSSITQQELFRFSLTTAGEPVNLSGMTFGWSSTGATVVQGDLANFKLFRGGTQVTGLTVAITSSQITFTGAINITGAQDFVLKGDVNNLQLNDSLTIGPVTNTSLTNPTGATSGLSTAVTGIVAAFTHTVSGYTVTSMTPTPPYKVGDSVTLTWTPVGTPSNSVNVHYFIGGVDYGLCGTTGRTATTCTMQLPPSAAAPATAMFKITDATNPNNVGTSNTFTVGGTLLLSGHSSGQAPNAFLTATTQPVQNKELFKFRLTATGEGVNLGSITLSLSNLTGITPSSDLSNLKLFLGATQVGGTPTVTSNSVIFGAVPLPSGPQDFVLKGDVASVAAGDTMTINLSALGGLATPRGTTSGLDLTTLSGAISGTVTPAIHTSSGYNVTLAPVQTTYKVGDSLTVSWTKLGNPGNSVTVNYIIGTTVIDVCGPQPTTLTSCAFTVPTTAAPAGSASFTVQDTADSNNIGLSPGFAVVGTLALGAHSSGQALNAFTTTPTVTNAELFRFKLTATGEPVNLSGLTLTWLGTGVVAADLSNFKLFRGAGASQMQVGGAATINSGTIAFGNFSVPTGGQDFVVKGDVANLVGGETMTLNLASSNLTAPTGAVSSIALNTVPGGAVTGSVAGVTHTASGYGVTLTPSKPTYVIGDNVTVSWTKQGSPGDAVNISYQVGGVDSGVCGTPGQTTASCTFTIPKPATAVNAAQFRVQDAANPGYQGLSLQVTVAGTLTLGESSSGQPTNAFVELPDVSNAELYHFKLTTNGEGVSLQQLTFGLVATGINAPDITGLSLLQSGTPVTATFVVSGSQITATLTGATVTGSVDFTLKGSVANLAAGDEMTVSLVPAGLKAKGATSQASLDTLTGALLGTVSTMRHFVKTYSISAPAAGANWPVMTTQNIAWTPIGGADPSNVTISYSTDGGTTYIPIISGASVPNPFPWLPPTSAISTQAKIKIADNTNPAVVGYSGGTKAGNTFNITGSISISSPPLTDSRYTNGIPRWPVGKAQTISWTTVGAMSQFRVFVDTTELVGSPTFSMNLNFTPAAASASATVKVADNSPGHPPSQATRPVVISQVQFLQPNASSVWSINRSQVIQWAQTGLDTVDIYYTTDGTTFTLIATNVQASLGSFTWNPVDVAARSPKTQIEIRDHVDPANGAKATSSQFKVVGQLNLTSPSGNLGVNAPYTIRWTTSNGPVPRVSLYLIDLGTNAISPIVTNQNNTDSFTWTPTQTIAQVELRLCDADFPQDDPDACNDTGTFAIAGIAVGPVASAYIVNDPLTITWSQVGLSGQSVNLKYSTDGGATFPNTIAPNVQTGATGSYPWTIPDALSSKVVVRVSDASGPAFGDSAPFAISGKLTVTGPVAPNDTYTVTGTMPISWTTLGTISTVNLEYSLNGGTNWLSIAPGVTNANAYSWTSIPLSAISNNFRVRVVDAAGVGANAAHAFTEGRSGVLHVGAKFTFSAPVGGENWAVNAVHPIGWSALGTGVTSIKLAYSGDGITYTDIGLVSMSGTSGEAKTYDWTVADIVAALGDPQTTPTRPFTLRITDATTGHPAVPADSASLNAMYYQVKWQVKDLASGAILNSLQALDSTGWTNAPAFDFTGLQTHYYPYLTQVSTLWALSNNNGSSDLSQGPADTAPVSIWKSDQNQTRVVLLEPASADAVTWQVKSEYDYDATANIVLFSTWLEKSGKIVDTPLPDYGYVQLYEDGNVIRELPQPISVGVGQVPDANGNIRITWDLKRADGTDAPDGKTYFGKFTIHRAGRNFSTGGNLNITIPKKIQQLPLTSGGSGGGGTGGTVDQQLINDVGTIKTAVTQTLPQQITVAQVAIQSNVTAAKDQLSAQVTDVKTDTVAIRTQTDKISTQVIPKLDGVQSYLEDTSRGFPAVLSRQDQTIDQLKDAKKGHLVNRNMVIEQGDQALIRYVPADPSSVPTIKIFGPAGFTAIGPISMAPNNGMFEWNQVFVGAPLGEYTVTVSEPSSTNSKGTLDSMTLYVRQPVATAKRVDDAMTILTDLSGQLTNIETQINTLTPSLLAVQTATTATRTLAQQIATDTQQLLTKWGTADAQQLQTELANLTTRIGAPVSGTLAQDVANLSTQVGTPMQQSDLASLQGAITNLTDLVNSLPSQFPDITTLQSTLDGLVTMVGTPATGSIAADIQDVRAAISAITGGSGGSGGGGGDLTTVVTKLDTLQTNLTALQAQVNDPAQRDRLETVISTIQTVQTDMAKEQTLTQVKDAVGQMNGTLTAMDGRVGTPLQQSDLAGLQAAVTQLTNLVQSLPTTFPDYTNQLNGIQAVLDTMDARVGTPIQQSDLAGLQSAVSQLTTLVQSLPTTFPDYTTQLNQLQTMLTQLTQNVGTPVQQSDLAGLQTAVANLTTLVNSLPSTFPNYQSDLTAIKTALSQLSLDMGRPIQQSDLTGLQSAVSQLTTLVQSLPTTFPDYTTQLQDVQTKLSLITTKMGSPLQQSDLPGLQASVNQLTAAVSTLPKSFPPIDQLQTSVDQLNAAVAKIPTADTSSDLQALKSSLTDLQTKVAAGSQQTTTPSTASGLDNATLLAKLETLQKAIESAEGSGAAVTFAQSASASAKEAADLLKQLQVTVQGGGPNLGGSDLLKQLNEKLSKVAESVSAVPDKMTMEKIREQLDTVAERVKTVSSEKGYKFDALYESHEAQASDVKTVRNRVEELKTLLEVQRSMLERKMNTPVMKTWFEAG